MRTGRSSASASRSIFTTFPEEAPAPGPLRGSGGLRRGRGVQPRDAHERRRVRIVERGVERIRRQRAGVVAMELDQGARELGGARVAAREIVRLELVATRPERGERSDEEGYSRRREGKERSEEHTSELQSPCNLVCRLLLEKKNTSTDV